MKKGNVISGIILSVFFLCSPARGLANNQGPEVLKVKGLYLGMNMEEGARILKQFITPAIAEKLGEGKPFEISQVPPFEQCNYGLGYFPPGCAQILMKSDCSKDKKVYHIFLHRDIANEMYDAKRLSKEEFVQLFEKLYDIKMKPKTKPDQPIPSAVESWVFQSDHGYLLQINVDHSIVIERSNGTDR